MEQPRSSQPRRTSHGDGPSTSRSEELPQNVSSVLFREIHKNGWLKKLPPVERRIGAFPKKGEKIWVVFCVHDDTEPFIEFYTDHKVAVAHKPDSQVSLSNCLHVSPTICPQEDEYEFVITLSSEVVRLTAPTWETMQEWVETIRSKLREMKILSPRENVYSRMPEARVPLAPTRDPNSPLPAPPAGPSAVVPGVEVLRSEPSESLSTTDISAEASNINNSDDNIQAIAIQPTNVAASSLYTLSNEPLQYQYASMRPRQIFTQESSGSESPSSHVSTPSSGGSGHRDNVTVIEVSTNQMPYSAPATDHPAVFNFSFMSESLPPLDISLNNDMIEDGSDNQETNSMYCSHFGRVSETENNPSSNSENRSVRNAVGMQALSTSLPINSSQENDSLATSISVNGDSSTSDVPSAHYECVFLPPLSSQNSDTSISISTGNTTRIQNSHEESSTARSIGTLHNNSNGNASPSQVASNSERSSDAEVSRRRRRSSSTSEASPVHHPSRNLLPERNRLAAGTSGITPERRLQPAPHPYHQGIPPPNGNVEVATCTHLSLKEQQVLQLRREMLHPGGVRLQLRRKDCTSIALVEAFGAVWVAGWKQREHPMLYNALHIGDQLLSTCRIPVHSATDAYKILRAATSLYVEFIIRRVPFGRVFAIRRDAEGQNLGIVQEGNTAEIRDIVPGSLAARYGIPPRAQTCDGLSLTNWVITEINGRPLNLFFKEGEVKDRLNSVGRDISILVQPFDLVRQLKKQLKSLRGYKDYIVQ